MSLNFNLLTVESKIHIILLLNKKGGEEEEEDTYNIFLDELLGELFGFIILNKGSKNIY